MLRITRLAGYGVILLGRFIEESSVPSQTARSLSDAVDLPRPTVSKILKALRRHGILLSRRGVNGGYRLAREPSRIFLSEIITALEGPIGMTECVVQGAEKCDKEENCSIRFRWHDINKEIRAILDRVSLVDMVCEAPEIAVRTPRRRKSSKRK